MGCSGSKSAAVAPQNPAVAPADAASAVATSTDSTSAPVDLKGAKIVFLLGGPGSGKGTCAVEIVSKHGFKHISTGDLLREEVALDTELGKTISAIMKAGDLVPLDTTILLLKNSMLKAIESAPVPGFLIDGFPRELSQVPAFNQQLGRDCDFVLFISTPPEICLERCVKRGLTSGRADDNEEAAKKRLDTYASKTEPVIKYYTEKDLVKKIDGSQTIEEVAAKVLELFGN